MADADNWHSLHKVKAVGDKEDLWFTQIIIHSYIYFSLSLQSFELR